MKGTSMRRVLISSALAGAALATAACGAFPDTTHYQVCQRSASSTGTASTTVTIKMEPDACNEADDDYNRNAKNAYVEADRYGEWTRLTVGDSLPAGLTTTKRPKGENVHISQEMDD